MHTIVLATANPGKIRELMFLLQRFDPALEVKGLQDYPEIGPIEETGTTFEENAMIKAVAASEATGLVAVADDSGLEVDALGGEPGVYSARYSGAGATDGSNNEKLLRNLAHVPPAERTARFRCVMVARAPGGQTLQTQGTWEGRIVDIPQGEGGFGYDPLFLDPEIGRTAAQMEPELKNRRSHRGRAMEKLLQKWPAFWRTISHP